MAGRQVTTEKGTEVQIGKTKWKYGVEGAPLQELTDHSHLMDDPEKLWETLKTSGYLFLRNFHDREEVLDARLAVLEYLHTLGGKLDPTKDWQEGVLLQRCGAACVPFMEGKTGMAHTAPIKKVLEGPRPMNFFSRLFGTPCRTFDFKWLRVMYNEGFTGAHVDNVYMMRGSPNLLTMWTPIGDVDISMGTLAVCEGSNSLPSFQQLHDTYTKFDVEKENLSGTGWFTEDPSEITRRFGGVWKTADFRAGDVLIFGMNTVHMSTTNVTGLARVSCDTRWQPACDPADERYVGNSDQPQEKKFGVYAQDKSAVAGVTMESKKIEWGFAELPSEN